ncbi:MAG: NitT/TauT family transport system substrate-binding protein [Streptosporangiaceae bacterium]|jgi:NitT/TauT family transport system substrate-binding protein|nr:transporter substrate-binding protein [Streptosporangiaceae bacterium]MDX6431219.1 NitT/TauT family transport system substrate-binding protein [Streptosporangiaceae bacterium]
MRFPRLHRASIAGLAALTAITLTATGCGGGGGSTKKSASGLEKTELNVGMLPVADAAQLKIAIDRGLFKAQGLTVKPQILQGGAEAIPKLKSGNLDLSFGAYVPFFMAQAAGAINLRIVADAFQSAPGTHVILVAKDSPIHSIKDLTGKKVGVNVKHNLSSLMVQATLQPSGIKLDDDKNFVPIPFPQMETALKTHSVDAVQAVEPFNTQLQKSIGARLITDLSQGPTVNFPVAGFATTQEFAKKNPKTVAAFQRAIAAAQALIADRKILEQVLPTYTKIDAATATTLHYGSYPTSLSTTRLQRVADIMQQYQYLTKPFDVKPLVSTG